LITHTYMRSGGGFEAQTARALAQQIEKHPGDEAIAQHVTLCWQAMGRAAIPALRDYYEHERTDLRLAALTAGAWLGDARAGQPLADLTRHEDPTIRILAVEALVHLPQNVTAFGALKELLDDEDQNVRIAAYETLAANDDALIGRTILEDDRGLKFIIDRVPSKKPLIYVTPREYPRIVIFQPDLSFDPPMIASLWDSKLLMRMEGVDVPLEVYYQPAPGREPRMLKAEPLVATLAYLMGHHPSKDRPSEGLDLTFGQVADALYTLCRDGTIAAPIEIETSPLARLVDEAPRQQLEQRPETGGVTPETTPDADGSESAALLRPATGG